MPRLFISYSRVDSPFVTEFVPLLQEVYGYENVWYDDNLRGGDIWWEEILYQVGQCDLFVYLLSNESVNSPYCRAEYTEANRLHKKILTVQVRGRTIIPDDLSRIQYVDMTNGVEDVRAFNRLHASIARLASRIQTKTPKPLWDEPTQLPQVPSEADEILAAEDGETFLPSVTKAEPIIVGKARTSRWLPFAAAIVLVVVLAGIAYLASGANTDNLTPTPVDLFDEANRILTQTAAAQTAAYAPTATPTDDTTATIAAILTVFYERTATVQTAIAAAWTDTPTATQQLTLTPTPSLTQTEDSTATANAQATRDFEATLAVRAATNAQATSDAQATLSVPTNTPEPTATSTETPSLTPTETPPPTATFTLPPPPTPTLDLIATSNAQATADSQAAIDAQSTVAAQQTQTQAAIDAYTDTPTARPTFAPIGIVTSNQTINVRSGPGTENDIVGNLVPNQAVEILATTPDGTWHNVRLSDEIQGYVAAELLTEVNIAVPVAHNTEWRPAIRNFDGIEMVLVPTGCFMMGSDNGVLDEQPAHRICFDLPFWIDRFEVSNAQYYSSDVSSEPNRPRIGIDWLLARRFCINRGGRLPTEAEWEYAARGPDGYIYPWGNVFLAANTVAFRSSIHLTANVGSRPDGVSWVGA